MSREEHTPGPWRWNAGALLANGRPSAWGNDTCLMHGLAHEPRLADAMLIVAAPDLLAALKAEMRPDGHALGCGVNHPGQTECDEHCALARAAIAKATGPTGETP